MNWYVLRSLYGGSLTQWTVVSGPFASFALASADRQKQVAKGTGGSWQITCEAVCLREGIDIRVAKGGLRRE